MGRAGREGVAGPFLFSVHHDDGYPEGDEELGVARSIVGRNRGQDFGHPSGWSMYHSETKVPGFPRHPHRGFETISISRHGFIDHSDSLGNGGRFGNGDVQWMTAGKGISHCEMFPLLRRDEPNRMEMFQMWIMLPKASRMAPPNFKMLWNHDIPVKRFAFGPDAAATVRLVAGRLEGWDAPPSPPKDSYASDPRSNVLIVTVELDAGTSWTLPGCADPADDRPLHRNVYFFAGSGLAVAGTTVDAPCRLKVAPSADILLEAGRDRAGVVVLQGRDIGEPVVQHGPFVGNTRQDILQAFADYQRDQFGRWPWPSDGVVHPRDSGRFAQYPNGTREEFPIEL